MNKTILADVDGFTPLIDALVDDIGVMGAAVFGRMWRYCQMENGICHASLETIAGELSISVRTVMRHSDELVGLGYLKDLTPDVKNKPHIYADTGKAGISVKIEGMTKSHSDKLSGWYDKKSWQGDNLSDLPVLGGMTKSHLKKEKKESKKESKKETVHPFTTRQIQAAYESCVPYKIDWVRGEGHAAKWLSENDYTPDEVIECYRELKSGWWKDKPLTLTSIKKQIGEWKHANITGGTQTGSRSNPQPTAQQLAAAEIINARRAARQAENG